MANKKISQLPQFTGNTSGSWLVMNDSGQTTTYKVLLSDVLQSGTSGTSGTSGSSGSSGTSGINGTSGTSGSSGSSGTSGSSGSSGSSGTSGSSGSSGSSGTSGSSGSSGSSGDSLFALTGSVWNTTNNVGITGSLIVSSSSASSNNILSANKDSSTNTIVSSGNIIQAHSGSIGNLLTAYNNANNVLTINGTGKNRFVGNTEITGSLRVTGSITATDASILSRNSNGSNESYFSQGDVLLNGNGNIIGLTTLATTGSKSQITTFDSSFNLKTIVELPCSSSWNNGTTRFKYPVEITGSVNITSKLNLTPQDPLPAGVVGDLAVSSSNNLYFHNGTSWSQIN